MHITVSAADLLSGATATLAAVPSRPTHPALGAIVLDTAEDSTLQLSGYDYTTSARMRMPVHIETPGRVAVSGRLLAQIAKLLPKKPSATLRLDGETLIVTADRSSFSLPLLDVREFPKLPQPGECEFTVEGKEFATAVTWAATAALSENDGRANAKAALTGIRLVARPNVLDVITTDGNRIHSSTIALDGPHTFDPVSAIVPAKVLETAAAGMGPDERVGLALGETVTVAGDRLIRTTPVLGNEYPPTHKIFDKDVVGTVYVNTAELAGALKRAASLTKQKSVRLMMTDNDSIIISTGRTSDMYTDEAESQQEIDAALSGNPPNVLVNGGYLADALAGIPRDSITLSFTGEVSPILGNLGKVSETGGASFAVMPLRSLS